MAKPDLNKGIYIKLDGELGKYHSIPIGKLVEIAQSFQELITGLAKIKVDQNEFDAENFVIELCDLKKGSVAPAFKFSERATTLSIVGDHKEQRLVVNEELNKILSVANTGDYGKLKVIYKNTEIRNKIVPVIYDFVQVFGDTPVKIGSFKRNKFVSGKKLVKFKDDAYTKLVGAKPKSNRKKAVYEEVAGVVQIDRSTGKTKVKKYFEKDQSSLSYTIEKLPLDGLNKFFTFPLTVPVTIDEDKKYLIECPPLNIYVVADDMETAQRDFKDDFAYVYGKIFNTSDDELGHEMKIAKKFLHLYIS